MTPRNTAFALAIAAMMSAAGSCFFACSRTDPKPIQREKVTIAYASPADTVLAAIALSRGFFQKEGLDVTPHLHPYGKPALQEVIEGKADFATVAETPVMFAVMQGEKIALVATVQTSKRDNAIVARKDRGILSAKDLRGKRLAATLGTTADFFMDSFLAANGISRNEVTVVDLKAEETPEALAKGTVDAASVFNPYLVQARMKLGGNGTCFFDEELYTYTFNIAARQEFIRRNPETVKKLLRALIKAEEFVREKPAESQRIAAEFGGLDVAILRGIWADTSFRVSLDQMLVLALEDESRWAVKARLTDAKKVPNYLDFIYTEALESVKPEAVRILR